MWAGDRPVATARVWHLAATGAEPPDANGASGADGGGGSSRVEVPADLPEPQPQRYFDGDGSWGYGRATEWRTVSGGFGRTTGAGDVWTRLRIPLIAGRPLDGLARFAVIADSANGLSAPKSMRDWWFIPPGVTMHLHRYPVGEWVRLTAASDPGAGRHRPDRGHAGRRRRPVRHRHPGTARRPALGRGPVAWLS